MLVATDVKSNLVDQLKDWISRSDIGQDGRLPPERVLAEHFDVNRAELRKALAALEVEGLIWRRVGKGTFLNRNWAAALDVKIERPNASPLPIKVDSDLHTIANNVSPPQAMQARLIFEPELARDATRHATNSQIQQLKVLAKAMRSVKTWEEYEEYDWKFHNLIAEASGNALLIELQRILNIVRRIVVWGHLTRRGRGPKADYHSFSEHDEIVAAIASRDRNGAAEAMRKHLQETASQLLD